MHTNKKEKRAEWNSRIKVSVYIISSLLTVNRTAHLCERKHIRLLVAISTTSWKSHLYHINVITVFEHMSALSYSSEFLPVLMPGLLEVVMHRLFLGPVSD